MKVSQLCLTLCDPMDPARLLCLWDSPGKNTGVGLPCPPPGNFFDPGIQHKSSALQTDSLPLSHWGSPFLLLNSLLP